MRIFHISTFAFALLISSCASDPFSRRFPNASIRERSFVRFLGSDGNLTPWEIRSYLHEHGIRYKLKQNGWVGKDVWEIEECGTWTSQYTGRKGTPEIIPVDIGLFYNQTVHPTANDPLPPIPPNADGSMFVYYDMMTEKTKGLSVSFDRQKNTARTELGASDGDKPSN